MTCSAALWCLWPHSLVLLEEGLQGKKENAKADWGQGKACGARQACPCLAGIRAVPPAMENILSAPWVGVGRSLAPVSAGTWTP